MSKVRSCALVLSLVLAIAPHASAEAPDSAGAEPVPAPVSPVESLLKDLKVSGYLDATYNYNVNQPSDNRNQVRVFDKESDTFKLQAVKLTVQKEVSAESRVGFRADVIAGDDAEVIHAAGLGESSDSFDLEQAYAEVSLGLGGIGMNDLNLKVGKYVTFAGAEVIESKDNWNISRGILFGYAIPFTHTGLRTTYTFDNGWDIALGVNNGWDVADDNNSAKTFEGHVGFNGIELPGDSSLTISANTYIGSESADNDGATRSLADTVVTYKTPWKWLTFVYNFDYANEDEALEDGSSASWYGHAGYARFDINDEWSFSLRGEYMNDDDGVRVNSGTPADYKELTGTVEYRPWKNLITRFEYRADRASEEVFNDEDGTTDTQSTFAGQMIVTF